MATTAINGLGQIGRNTFKILLDTPELELRAVNDLNAADDRTSFKDEHDELQGAGSRLAYAIVPKRSPPY